MLKIKKFIGITMAVLLASALFSAPSFADINDIDSDVLEFQDFENYNGSLGAPWEYWGGGRIEIVESRYGRCAKTVSSSGKRVEMIKQFLPGVKNESVKIMYSAMFGDFNSTRSLFMKDDGANEYYLYTVGKDGITVFSGGVSTGLKLNMNVWYAFTLEYVPMSGSLSLTISKDGNVLYSGKTAISIKNVKAFTRIDFVNGGTSGTDISETYYDNVAVYSCPPKAEKPKVNTFEDFISAQNGQTPPKGFALQGALEGSNGLYGEEVADSGRGKSVKIQSDGQKNFEVIDNTLKFSGKDCYEADILAKDIGQISFGIRGTDASGGYVGASTLFSFKEGGLYLNNIYICDVSSDVWYKIKLYLDFEAGECELSLIGDDGSGTAEPARGTIPGHVITVSNVQFMALMNKKTNAFYFDNVAAYPWGTSFNVTDSEVMDTVDILPDFTEMTFDFTKEIDVKKLTAENVTVNGTSELVKELAADGGRLTVKLEKELDFNTHYSVRLRDIADKDGNTCNYRTDFLTAPKFVISDFGFSKQVIEGGEIEVSANVMSLMPQGQNITLILLIKSKEGNKYIKGDYDFCRADGAVKTLKAKAAVPEDAENYIAYAYIWDSCLGMDTLITPIKLN